MRASRARLNVRIKNGRIQGWIDKRRERKNEGKCDRVQLKRIYEDIKKNSKMGRFCCVVFSRISKRNVKKLESKGYRVLEEYNVYIVSWNDDGMRVCLGKEE